MIYDTKRKINNYLSLEDIMMLDKYNSIYLNFDRVENRVYSANYAAVLRIINRLD